MENNVYCQEANNNNTNNNSNKTDRLSSLPDDLIHHILSFVSISHVFLMHSLSKKWRTMWLEIPTVNIQNYKDDYALEYKVLKRRLNRLRQEQHRNITSFKLLDFYPCGNRDVVTKHMYDLLGSVTKTNTLKELHIRIEHGGKFRIPGSVLKNVRSSLTLLKLEGDIRTERNSATGFPSLKTLYLKEPIFGKYRETLENLISECPSIENLHLEDFRDFESPKDFDSAENNCASLTSLLLNYCSMSDEWLESAVSGLPVLERLTLTSCSGLQKPSIRSESLKCFCWNQTHGKYWRGFTLDAPNLVDFNHTGTVPSMFSINSTGLLKVTLSLFGGKCYGTGWYLHLILFLSYFHCSASTKLTLYLPSDKDLFVPENIKKICVSPLPDLKHLKVKKMWSRYPIRYTNDDFWIPSESSKAALLWWAPYAETLEIEYKPLLDFHI